MESVAIGSDHAGFELKQQVKEYLATAGYRVEDVGCESTDSVDYPDYAKAVGEAVSQGKAKSGVLICNTGIGMCMTANKITGIRAALVSDLFTAQMSREHNDANVLVMGAKNVDKDRALEIVKKWFSSKFQGGRHGRRVDKINKLEEGKGS